MDLIAAIERVARSGMGPEKRAAITLARLMRKARIARRDADYELGTNISPDLPKVIVSDADDAMEILATL